MKVTSIEPARAGLVVRGLVEVTASTTVPPVTPGQCVAVYAKVNGLPAGAEVGGWTLTGNQRDGWWFTRDGFRVPVARDRLVGSTRVAAVFPTDPQSPDGARAVVGPSKLVLSVADRRWDMSAWAPMVWRPDHRGTAIGAVVLWRDPAPVEARCPFCWGTGAMHKTGAVCGGCAGVGQCGGPLVVPGGGTMYGWWDLVPSDTRETVR